MLAPTVIERRSARLLLLSVSTILCSGLSAPAFAQSLPVPPPARYVLDQNGVNLAKGAVTYEEPSLEIGPGGDGMSFHSQTGGLSWNQNSGLTDVFYGLNVGVGGKVDVFAGRRYISFTPSGGAYANDQGGQEILAGSNGSYTLTLGDGTIITMNQDPYQAAYNPPYTTRQFLSLVTSIVKPSGEKIRYYYTPDSYCDSDGYCTQEAMPTLISSSNGYGLYVAGSSFFTVGPSVTTVNLVEDNCNTTTGVCASISSQRPKLNYNFQVNGTNPYGNPSTDTITDNMGRATVISRDASARVVGIRRPGSSSDNISISYDSNSRVSSVVKDGGTWTYSYSVSGNLITANITNPDSSTRTVVSDTNVGLPVSVRDELNHVTTYQYDAQGRVTTATLPEGNKIQYTYDTRGNVTQTRKVSKTPGTPADIVTSAAFASSCTNALTCNKPISTTDALGRVTDYAYDGATGFVTSVTSPAATTGAVRPQTRYSYTPLYAWYKNSAGSTVQAATSIYKLTGVSSCVTSASCVGTADEIKSSISYQAGSSGAGSNLLPTSVSTGSGNGALTSTITRTYDNVGNLITVDGSLAGSADTIRYRYDADRELIGVIGPDPDGSGGLKNRALRYSYASNGQPSMVELGTVTDQSDGAWSAFSSLQQLSTAYDSADRKVRENLTASGTTYTVKQYSYDSFGRLSCTALRMDSAQWSGQTNVCAPQTTGSNGPDRITKNNYDAAGQLASVTDGYGTSAQRTEHTVAYTNNGLVQTVKDAKNNLTTYEYDGFDRLLKTRYPVQTAGANSSSSTDYELLSYDAGDNVTSRRVRDGGMIYYAYDNLGRRTSEDRPNTVWWETDHSYGYDLLGRLTLATDSNGHAITLGYDALGRKTSEASNWYGAMTSAYDLAGRRTSLTYPDGFYVTYDHLVTGETTAIREYGAASGVGVLASYSYDDLGRRILMYRGNTTGTGYTYDAISRLASFNHNVGGTAQDVSFGFSYNPASQIVSSTRSNDSYAFTQNYNVNRSYSINGLNQYSSAGSLSMGYDGRGNLTSSGTSSYGYTADNQLATAPNSYYAYDPLGRLFHESTPQSAMLYDGSDMMLERDSSNGTIRRRYVYDPDTNAPIIWYEGSGTSDRRWLHADERGSVIAVTNSGGTVIGINSYDEYGIPASGNIGRFQYTGQMWLPDLGMYNYKARIYSPTLGRFMQTDPIGYANGLNWYAYVGNDPINATDPTGLSCHALSDDPCDEGVPDIVVTGQGGSFTGTSSLPSNSVNYSPSDNSPGGANAQDPKVQNAICMANPQSCIIVTANQGIRGPIFGSQVTGYRGSVALTDVYGGDVYRDFDNLLRYNGQKPLGAKGTLDAPPAGFKLIVTPTATIIRNLPTGLQIRISDGSYHLDIPPGSFIDPRPFGATTLGGEVVHYN